MKMKRKLFVILMFISSLFIFNKMDAQGIYGNNNGPNEEETTGGTGLFRADPPSLPGGDPGSPDAPVGEGLVILSVLAGGYAAIKKKGKHKKKNKKN
jgi:hypothetical protein